MPLQVQCKSCGRILVLNDAFAGGRCRCQHCRTVTAVPNSRESIPTESTRRPSRPLLIGELPTQPLQTALSPIAAKASLAKSNSKGRRIVTLGRVSGALGILAIIIGLPAAYFALRGNTAPTIHQSIARADAENKADHSNLKGTDLALATADPLTTYFGLPVEGEIIGYVVDGDATMSSYIDRVAMLTNGVTSCFVPGSKRYGIAQVFGENGQSLVETAEPVGDLDGSRLTLGTRTSNGRTDLSRGLTAVSGWYADQVFLVMSKSVKPDELQKLASTAEQTGAIVNVVALGEAAKQPQLAEVAAATRGKYIPVSDDMLTDLVSRQRAAIEDRNQMAARN